MMMVDREKVIKAIEICYTSGHNCTECPLFLEDDCNDKLMHDTLTFLKEQEARVMTREELKQCEGSPCWFESHGTYMGKDGFWIIPAMFRTFFAGIIMSYTSVLDGVGDYGELGLSAYNKTWRCWTTKPKTEQRKAVEWE